ncbi:helix-turn-helix transcriptional regulator [Methanolacinia paynteri]|uniref:helix-turn-helix transcriptional regulator n=1 Tax=Methanolacinia paynteri TaxID=230356 RepID=UPI00064E5EBB|nr:transcriptional regulator FilR1 domain-containing protein [Methanolacinia paynteri]
MNPVIDAYNERQAEIRGIFRSRLITQILIALGEGEQSLSGLRDITGSSSQAIIPKIRQLEALSYIESTKEGYRLTIIGKILEKEIEKLVKIISLSDSNREFWYNHDTRDIPAEFLENIGDLHNSTIIHNTEDNILKVHFNFIKLMDEASFIKGISSFMSPSHAEIIKKSVMRGIQVDLIVTPEIAEKMKEEPYEEILKTIIDLDNFMIYIYPKPIKIGMTITDNYLSLGLYSKEPDFYDFTADLINSDGIAVEWGQRLFEYYRSGSEDFIKGA